jgi:hypothetical protein
MSDPAELAATIEQVRTTQFPQLPPDLVQQILAIEAAHVDDRATAMRDIKAAVLMAARQAEHPDA